MHEIVVSTYCHNPIHAGTCSDVFDGRFERGSVGASRCVLEHLAQEQPVLPMVMGVGIHAEWMGECMMVAALCSLTIDLLQSTVRFDSLGRSSEE